MVVVEVKEKWLIGVVVVFLAWSFGGVGQVGGLGAQVYDFTAEWWVGKRDMWG